jgi:hypothetical protein
MDRPLLHQPHEYIAVLTRVMPGLRRATREPPPGEQSAAGCETLGTPVISGAVDHRRAIHIRLVGNGSDVSLGETTSQGACHLSIEPLAMRIAPIESYAAAARDIPRHELVFPGIREVKSYPTFELEAVTPAGDESNGFWWSNGVRRCGDRHATDHGDALVLYFLAACCRPVSPCPRERRSVGRWTA